MSDKNQQAADQVRPILRAMERSIEDARNRRKGIDDEPRTFGNENEPTAESASLPIRGSLERRPQARPMDRRPIDQSNLASEDDQPVRLKARPKRRD